MNNIIMRSNKVAGFFNIPAPSPLGVEYEELKRNLEEHTKEKYKNREDMRKYFKKEDSIDESKDHKTFMLSPGMLMDYTNDQSQTPPYPIDGPSSAGTVRWSD